MIKQILCKDCGGFITSGIIPDDEIAPDNKCICAQTHTLRCPRDNNIIILVREEMTKQVFKCPKCQMRITYEEDDDGY